MKIIIKTLLLVQIWFGTYFILLPGASVLPDVTYVSIVLATSLISLLHTVLDGGPRKWTYEDPSKPMTYQHVREWKDGRDCVRRNEGHTSFILSSSLAEKD